MTPTLIFICFAAFTVLLFIISFITSRKAKNESYFIGERKSSWPIVAYGMIGASLSGVTFISIPGDVYNSSFSYMMVVFGYILGYAAIATILLPVYYKLKLTTIYTYLKQRFGNVSYRT
ncbi:MAG: sodium:solute symporter, partial [Bacteroidales bacterium]|nr:sodium:solute symporter [Bacteroidales bacterium]